MREKISNLIKKIREHKKKVCLAVGLSALLGVTAIKDNVHFGSTNLYNPKENHYVWGVLPITKVQGQGQGSIYTFGLLIGINDVGDNSTITGNQGAYGLLIGGNEVGDNSTITGNQGAYGLITGANGVGDNSAITGNQGAYGLFAGGNEVGKNSTITGNQCARGIIVKTVSGISVGSKTEIGLENYLVKKEDKETTAEK